MEAQVAKWCEPDSARASALPRQEYDIASFQRNDGEVRIDFMNGDGPWRTARTSAHPQSGLAKHRPGRAPQ